MVAPWLSVPKTFLEVLGFSPAGIEPAAKKMLSFPAGVQPQAEQNKFSARDHLATEKFWDSVSPINLAKSDFVMAQATNIVPSVYFFCPCTQAADV